MSSCEPDKLLIREKYYIYLGAEYNIVKDPTIPPMSGRKHSEESKTKISDAMVGNTNKKGQTLNDDTKQKISDTKKGKPKVEGSGKPSQQIEITDIKNDITTSYNSISEAARALNCNESSIRSNIKSNSNKPYKGRYTFKKLN